MYSGKLSKGKTSTDLAESEHLNQGENFHKILYRWVWHAQNFEEKTFAGGTETVKFMKVFSLESPPHCTVGIVLCRFS